MRYFVIFTGTFLVLACASVAMAVAPAASGEQVTPSWTEEFSATSGHVDIGGGTGVGVYLDPNAGPWQKIIFGIFVSPLPINETINIMADPRTIPPLPGGPAWTDWDELILTPGWGWANASLVITEPDQTQKTIAGTVKTILNPSDFVEFDFNPAENPGASLFITKSLVWNGPPGQMPLPSTVIINEYPTPEPATIVLLISGLLALGLGYIRQRK